MGSPIEPQARTRINPGRNPLVSLPAQLASQAAAGGARTGSANPPQSFPPTFVSIFSASRPFQVPAGAKDQKSPAKGCCKVLAW